MLLTVPALLAHTGHAAAPPAGHGLGGGRLLALAVITLVAGALLVPRATAPTAVVGLGLVVAGGVHALAAPEHLQADAVMGALFVWVALVQVSSAALLRWMPSPGLASLVAGANLVFVAAWAMSRTVGLPFGPDAGEAEAVGALDAIAMAAELVVVAACSWLVRPVPAPAPAVAAGRR